MVREIIAEELHAIQKIHKTGRKTQIVPAEEDFDVEDLIPDEQVIITISGDDYVKRMPISLFREQKREGRG